MKSLIIWPKSEIISHINYHYAQFGEVVDYLNKNLSQDIIALDYDVENVDVNGIVNNNEVKKVVMLVNYENANNSFELARALKEQHKDISILAYGPLPVMLPNLFRNSSFDAMFKDGDFETCIQSFLTDFEKDEDLSKQCNKLKGMYLIDKDEFYNTRKGEWINDKDWGISREGQVPVTEYDKIKGKNRYVLSISRGCPFGCPHCLIQLTEGRKERRRSIENLNNAIGEIKDKYKHIKLWAANFTLDKQYVKEFCNMMQEKYPEVTWECATRIDLVKDEKMLDEMYKSGCRQVSLGVESLNNGELIHTKDFNESEIYKAISNVQNAGIKVKGCVMLGMPDQTKESIINTLKFLKDNNVIIRPTIYTPYHLLDDNVKITELSKYNRKTLENNNVKGVTSQQLLQLVKQPYDYEEILHCITPGDIAKLTKDTMVTNPGYISNKIDEITKEINNKSMEEAER